MPKQLEITAVFLRERFRFENTSGDVIVGDIRHIDGPKPEGANCSLAIKGPAEQGQLKEGLPYRFFGRWTSYKNKRRGTTEQQFSFQTVVPSKPVGQAGVVAYLSRHGEGLGIGKGRANILWEAFGPEAVKVCRERPEEAMTAVPRWKIEQAKALAARLGRAAATEQCSMELVDLLSGRGFPHRTVGYAIATWGNTASEVIRRNPYRLLGFSGCGFKRADAMYLDLGLPPGKLKRQALCAWHSIDSDSGGHTWFPVQQAIHGIQKNIAGCDLQITKAIKLAKRAGLLAFARTDKAGLVIEAGGQLWCAKPQRADCEAFTATSLATAEREPQGWPHSSEVNGVSDHQRKQLTEAMAGMIGVLGGGPGTGKTYTAAALILAIINSHGSDSIAVAAPTGKASVRISEALAAYQIPLKASTIHSLLKIDPETGGFYFRSGRPLPFRFIVVDEASMIDTDLMASLLAARATGTHVLFVGDIHQLPPVGHGAPLRDFLAAKLPAGELIEIQRQAAGSMIVQACHAIRAGKQYQTLPDIAMYDGGNANLTRIEASQPDRQIEALQQALRWIGEHGFHPVWEVQVLAAVNAKSQLARKSLNRMLQQQLNSQPPVDGSPFRLGDKIVNTRNAGFSVVQASKDSEEDPEEDPKEFRVANGDLAEVVEVAEKYLLAKLAVSKHVIRIPRGKPVEANDSQPADGDESDQGANTGCSWELAYALSVHKSQGSEWPVAIVMLDEYPGAMRIASREWLYTANSRGKQLQVEIGKAGTARKMLRQVALGNRKTLLRERIAAEQCRKLVETI